MQDVAIIGAGQTAFVRKCGVSIRELCFEAFQEAMEDAQSKLKSGTAKWHSYDKVFGE